MSLNKAQLCSSLYEYVEVVINIIICLTSLTIFFAGYSRGSDWFFLRNYLQHRNITHKNYEQIEEIIFFFKSECESDKQYL